MKYFPLKTIIFCIIFIPLLSTITVTRVEKYLNILYKNKITQQIKESKKKSVLPNENIGNAETVIIQNAIDTTLKSFSQSDIFFKYFNLLPNTCVKIKEYGKDAQDIEITIAIRHNTILSNLILSMYIAISLYICCLFYKNAISKLNKEHLKKREAISNLMKDEQEYLEKLEELKKEREVLTEKLAQAKSDYEQEIKIAKNAEEELFNEIVELEKKVEENSALQREKEIEIEELKSQLEKVEKRKNVSKKRKSSDGVEKRFLNLYKNVDMNKKAIEGLLDLDDEDMQLKAEEVVHQLNDDPSEVLVKRKVFTGKKNKTASFEVLFAYNGRLYFRNIEGNRIEVLVIGTKNSQDKDMEFLHSI
ncbi:MAG: hypothetical protein HQK72_07160 [Desulfamplus sp.]|nr:hypothetical protein [Desulfamplus sp.]